MKIFLCLCFTLLFGLSLSAQSIEKNTEAKFFNGDEYMPFIFEPYQADYSIDAKVIGIDFSIFKLSAKVVELDDHWVETQNWHLPAFTQDLKTEELSSTTEIDLKTGLIKKMNIFFKGEVDGRPTTGQQEILFLDEKMLVSNSYSGTKPNREPAPSLEIALKDKIYPCQSVTFFSYLPLKEGFTGSFTCLNTAEGPYEKSGTFMIDRQTISVKGIETITTKAGTFEAFKISQSSQSMGYFDRKGNFREAKKKAAPKEIDQEKAKKGFFSNCWIDTKSRKMIKAEMRYRNFGGITIMLLPKKFGAV